MQSPYPKDRFEDQNVRFGMVHFEGHFKGTYGLRAKEGLKMRRGRSMKISSQSIFD